MSPIDLPLVPGEQILFRTRQHWTVVKSYYALAVVLVLLGSVLTTIMLSLDVAMRPFSPWWGVACVLSAPAVIFLAKVTMNLHEYVLTNLRLIVKTPLSTIDFYLDNVQGVKSDKSLFGNYGWLFIVNAGVKEGLDRVERCQELALLIEQQVALRKIPAAAQAATVPTPPPQ
jgi:hypothetical protein